MVKFVASPAHPHHRYVGSIDQGTTSSRFLIFNDALQLIAGHQIEHRQLTPQPGWLEHDPMEIFENTCRCIVEAVREAKQKDPHFSRLSAIGVTNQRETTVAWDRHTKRVLYNAVVWSDVRTAGIVSRVTQQSGAGDPRFAAAKCGLPVSTYFSATKMMWMMENVDAVRDAAQRGTLCFGTIDSWLLWKLTGERVHATDATNASRTMLMNIETLTWDVDMCRVFGIPLAALPQIRSCSEHFGVVATEQDGVLASLGEEVPLTGCIGDQQGALVGNLCFQPGQAKNTYGTGCFLLANVGTAVVHSRNGLLATVGYRFGPTAPCHYALEGAIAGAGATMQWMRDRLQLFKSYGESEELARSVEDTGGVAFVPAFSGLLAPHWKPDARGVIVGMTLQTTKAHVVRAALEAISMQVAEVVQAMQLDAKMQFSVLKVDGGLVKSSLLMELQADALGIPVHVPAMLETTALGAAICAGLAVGVWSVEELSQGHRDRKGVKVVTPMATAEQRNVRQQTWKKALERCYGWAKL